MTEGLTICWACKHLRSDSAVLDGWMVSTCDAFPDGIPTKIFVDGFDHRQEFAGDNGVRFEPVTEEEGSVAVRMIEDNL